MFHANLTERLKAYLKETGVPDEKLNESLVILTQAREKSLIQIEREEFLRLALKAGGDSYHRELFSDLYRRFRDQDASALGLEIHSKEYEARLEEKVSELASRIKPTLLKSIQAHYLKYFYVNHMWVGSISTFEYYLKELVKLVGTDADVAGLLKKEEGEWKANLKKRNELLRKLKIGGKWKLIFEAFGDFMITKIYRRFAQIYAVYKMEFILREIGRRLDLSLMQVRFMLPQEIRVALLHGKVGREELRERTKFCVYYAEKGRDAIFTGAKAEKLAEVAQRVEIGEVQELKGQTGCVGRASGAVKIIIRPADMSKMNKGDILVSIATDPDIVPAMKKAAAIVTEQGGVTSHAAIVSRELNIPCVIGTKIATKVLKDGDLVEVDANQGIVRKL
ncbi:hypothetical protein HY406_01400 [Candidatus Giovannonibacteria bacterium]|nr:hypothetical protein [Candidatus Giovannonibacteria bacterium]